MTHVESFEQFKKEIPIQKIKTEKELVPVETKNPQNILSIYNQGKMPLDKARVDKMVDILLSGGKLPPVVVDNNLLLKDGHHRYQAHIQAGKTKITIT